MAETASGVCDFGWKAMDFQLKGVDGKTYGLDDVRGPRGLLVMFICNHCPYVRAVIHRVLRDTLELEALGVKTLAIMSNDTVAFPDDSFEKMKEFSRTHSFHFPYVIDETQEVARAYGAVCTPDFFGFNAELGLQYRGRLDASRRDAVPNARRDLFEAMKLVAETGEGPRIQVPSIGCSLKWRDEE